MYRILIVEDDAVIAGAVARHITQWGLEARCVRDFRNVLGEFRDFDPQLVLLDLALPAFDGYHWCREIRKVSSVPVIFVSSASSFSLLLSSASTSRMKRSIFSSGDSLYMIPFISTPPGPAGLLSPNTRRPRQRLNAVNPAPLLNFLRLNV